MFTMTYLKKLTVLICLFGLTTLSKAQTQHDNKLTVDMQLSPQKCVSLRERQSCYANVTVTWTSSLSNDFCLFSSQSEQALECWTDQTNGSYIGEAVASKHVTFFIKKVDHEAVLASSILEIAWVYKRKRSSMSWRIF